MKKQIVNVSPLQTAKVFAALYFVMSIPLVLLSALPAMMMGQGASAMPLYVLILMPIFYVLFGFVFTLIGAWVYNLVASKVGGIEYTTVDVGQ